MAIEGNDARLLQFEFLCLSLFILNLISVITVVSILPQTFLPSDF